ncbi:hypothetical protein PISMIDRAFT_17348 [Pisolithus microcarpus 441]|uniref:Uncharacterized protein n=1 Tax=Pisolithus microcarpus 441 TaxID=765257 RepID=A0A0C9Z2S1_9AGAM|nr:hypothetical protein PISMIDRAFT_17348 [Pisolithus microcarpus 441]
MSQQPQGTSHQTTATPSWDWTQVPDKELEVLVDDSKGTEQAKEVKRNRQETVKKQRRAKVPIYSPTTGAKLGKMVVLIYQMACNKCQQKRKKKCSWVAEDREASMSGARKCTGMGGSQGEKKKRGQSGAEDEEVDKEAGVDKGSEMLVPCFEVAGSCLIGERELRHRLPPDDEYHGQLLVTQEQQVMVMEQQAAAQEAQAVTIQVYMQAMQGQMWPPFPPTMAPWVGVPQGGAASATGVVNEQGGSGMREGMKSGGSEQGDLGDEQGDEMDDK